MTGTVWSKMQKIILEKSSVDCGGMQFSVLLELGMFGLAITRIRVGQNIQLSTLIGNFHWCTNPIEQI